MTKGEVRTDEKVPAIALTAAPTKGGAAVGLGGSF